MRGLVLAAFLLVTGCAQVTTGADKIWPALVVISGQASVPATFSVADLRPARSLTVRVVAYGAESWDAVAVGRVSGDEGRFTVSVPEDVLAASPRAFETQAIEPGGRVVLASPVALERDQMHVDRDLDPYTTVVAIAARRAGPDRKRESWDVDALAKLPEVRLAADRLGAKPPQPLSAQSAQASGDQALRSFALLPDSGDVPELGSAIAAVLKAAP